MILLNMMSGVGIQELPELKSEPARGKQSLTPEQP
jgi:hypothetical protein